MKKIIIPLLFLLLIPNVYGLIEYNCTNGVLTSTETFNINNRTITINDTITCDNGCAPNEIQCEDVQNVPTQYFFASVGGILFIALLYLIAGIHFKDDLGGMEVLFFGATIILSIMGAGMLTGWNNFTQTQLIENVSNAYWVAIVVFTIFVVYYLINLIMKSRKILQEAVEEA